MGYTTTKMNQNFGSTIEVCKIMKVKSMTKELPIFATRKGDAGYDLYTTETVWLWPFHVNTVKLNIKCQLPSNTFGFITSRSGLGSKGIVVVNGIIDEIYRGYFHASIYKIGLLPKRIKKGTKIAQMIIVPYVDPYIEEVDSEYELTKTIRGTDCFGSTGIN